MRSFCGLFWELLLLGSSEKPIRRDIETVSDAANVSKREALRLELLSYGAARDFESAGEVCFFYPVLFHH